MSQKKFLRNIFSITNRYKDGIKHKVIRILGIKISYRPLCLIEKIEKRIADIVAENTAREVYSALAVQSLHSKVFPEFLNSNNGNSVAIIGCGPSVKYYNNEFDTKNIALNDALFFENIKYDYLFNWDDCVLKRNPNWYEDVKKYDCHKFYGMYMGYHFPSVPIRPDDEENKIKHFYYSARHNLPAEKFGEIIYQDISTYPLMDFGTVASGALHFALYTRPKKIYLIGLDTSNAVGSIVDKNSNSYQIDRMLRGYKKFKEFANLFYPDVEIISVNPVGLKGLFKDVYTKKYVDEHPELLEESITIV